ncbi:MAG: cytochrome c [Chitinophagaceae bacterium]|nr:cytochrome c [Chitinophagaceae bacterium]
MNRLLIIPVLALTVWACSDVRRSPGRVYMPDMAYSRAYETYAPTANLDSHGIHYDKMPVAGTIKRGEYFPFPLAKDKDGDTTNYTLSKQVVNPMPALNEVQMKEAERLYLVNCGICHGMKLDGNGPLYNGGNGPYAAAPRNLTAEPVLSMPDGQIFYSMTYGKGQMGPYGPQLSTTQRWMIVHYINSKQAPAAEAPKADSTTAGKGSVAKVTKTN